MSSGFLGDVGLVVHPRSVTRPLTVIAIAFGLVSCLGQWGLPVLGDLPGYEAAVRMLRLNAEGNLSVAFAVALLSLAAGLLALVWQAERAAGHADAPYWLILAVGFVGLALDEALQFHERLNGPARALLGQSRPGIVTFAWVLPGTLIVLALGLFFFRFVRRQAPAVRRRLLLAGGLYVAGGIGFEALGGWWVGVYGDSRPFGYVLLTTFEEECELFGVILLIGLLLTLLGQRRFGLRFSE
jgi:hypothetical protein